MTDPQTVYMAMTAVDTVSNAKTQHRRWKNEIASRKGDEISQKIKTDVSGISRYQNYRIGDFPDKEVRFRNLSFDMKDLEDSSDSDITITGETGAIPRAYPLTDYVWLRNEGKEDAQVPTTSKGSPESYSASQLYSGNAQKESSHSFGSPSETSVTDIGRSSWSAESLRNMRSR